METMDKRKKNRLIKGIVFNATIFVGCTIYVVVSLLPKYSEINSIITKINNTMTYASSLEKNGVNKDSFVEILDRLGKKREIPANVFSNPEKLEKALVKPVTIQGNYLSWIAEENAKVNTLDREIQKNDKILGNIIPVFMNSSTINTDDNIDNQITIASFISYVEKDILGKYALTSYVPLGISNITFPDKKDISVNIGSFKITLDFKGKNRDILSLIEALQKSGEISIRNGKLVSDTSVAAGSSK